jgi:hypothetical protein
LAIGGATHACGAGVGLAAGAHGDAGDCNTAKVEVALDDACDRCARNSEIVDCC